MVSSVSPSYYARLDNERAVFEVQGHNLDMIPSDAVGIAARRNDMPLEYLDTDLSPWLLEIVSQSNVAMLLQHEDAHTMSNIYLGAIVSADRQTVYWVNETRPLP